MSKTPEQTVVDTSQDPSLGYIKAREVSNLISAENGIITTQTNKGYVVNTLENVTKVINNVVETNVSADWNADEGPNAILNKPNLEIYTTRSDVDDAIANLINSAPGALNTLGELANALGNSANYASTITNELALKASITYVDNALANISDISIGNIEFNDTTLSIVGGDEVKDITIVTGDNKQFVFGADGTLTVPDVIQSSVNGIPKFASATDIILEAVNRVKVQGGTFKLASKTNGQRQLLLPQAGDMIYNSTVNAIQVYTGSVWVSLGSGDFSFEGGSISDLTPEKGLLIAGSDVPEGGSGATGSVYIRGGIDYTNNPLTQERVYINNAYIQGTTLGQDDPTANLNLYSAWGMEFTTTGGGMKLDVGPSMFGYGEDILISAGNGGDEGAQSSDGGDLILTAGNGGFNAEGLPEARGGNVIISGGAGPGGLGAVVIESGSNSWVFGGAGTLTLPQYNQIESVGSNARISLNGVASNESIIEIATNMNGEMLTSGIDITPAIGINLNSVRNVNITAGWDSATFKYDAWVEAEQIWVDIRNQDATDIAPGTRTWAGLPSYEAYPLLMDFVQNIPQGEIPPPSSMAPAANTAKAAYELWQAEQTGINVTVSAKDKIWTFGNNGQLTVPGSITSPDRLTLNSVGVTSEYTAAVLADGNLGRVFVRTLGGTNATLHTWEFNKEGQLKLPAGGDIVDSAGTSVLGGAASTGNITFIGDSIESSNNIVNVSASNFAQLESTDGSNTTQIWAELNNAVVFVNGTSWRFNTPTVAGASSNALEMPNGIMQRSGDHVTCAAGVDTVIYTSALDTNHTIKLLLNIEGVEDGQTDTDTQSCEMIVAKGMRANSVAGSAYGLVYTSASPLVTLSTRWNAVDSRVEITCRPVSLTNQVSVRSTGIEVAASGAG